MAFTEFVKSLWKDPFKWSLVKSFVVFGAAIFIAREYVAMEAEDMAAQAAEKLPATCASEKTREITKQFKLPCSDLKHYEFSWL